MDYRFPSRLCPLGAEHQDGRSQGPGVFWIVGVEPDTAGLQGVPLSLRD